MIRGCFDETARAPDRGAPTHTPVIPPSADLFTRRKSGPPFCLASITSPSLSLPGSTLSKLYSSLTTKADVERPTNSVLSLSFYLNLTMFSRSIAAMALSLVPALVAAQEESVAQVATSIANTTLQMQAVGLIPDPVPTSALNLTAALGLRFGQGSGDVATGQTVSVDQAKGVPEYTLEYADAAADELDDATFTVLFLDAGAAGVGNPGEILST